MVEAEVDEVTRDDVVYESEIQNTTVGHMAHVPTPANFVISQQKDIDTMPPL